MCPRVHAQERARADCPSQGPQSRQQPAGRQQLGTVVFVLPRQRTPAATGGLWRNSHVPEHRPCIHLLPLCRPERATGTEEGSEVRNSAASISASHRVGPHEYQEGSEEASRGRQQRSCGDTAKPVSNFRKAGRTSRGRGDPFCAACASHRTPQPIALSSCMAGHGVEFVLILAPDRDLPTDKSRVPANGHHGDHAQ